MSKHEFLKFGIKKEGEEEEEKKNMWTLDFIEILPFFYFLTSSLLGSSMAVAKIDFWLQDMLTLEPSGKRYFERTSALSEVSEMKAPNDYTICFCPYFVVQS